MRRNAEEERERRLSLIDHLSFTGGNIFTSYRVVKMKVTEENAPPVDLTPCGRTKPHQDILFCDDDDAMMG
jgi:hypothetical protein